MPAIPSESLKALALQNISPFITIKLPLNSDDPYKLLDELIDEAKKQLKEAFDADSLEAINKKLNKLKVKLPPQNLFESFIALISNDTEEIIPLNVPLEKKVNVGTGFNKEEIENLKKKSCAIIPSQVIEYDMTLAIYQRYYQLRPFGKKTY
ncbi:MAG TPA: hypothetical protein VD908_16525 [Cytophagales bacterium]|nr:hypothetical protein [Cytophagales bacterium]